MLLQDTLSFDVDIFAASGASAALENPFKTKWRKCLSCSPTELFSTAFGQREDNVCILEGRLGMSASTDQT